MLNVLEEHKALSLSKISLRKVFIKMLQRTIQEKVAYWVQRGKVRTALEDDENSVLPRFHYKKNACL